MSDINTKFIFKTMEYKNLTTEMDKNFQQKLKDRENKMHVDVVQCQKVFYNKPSFGQHFDLQ